MNLRCKSLESIYRNINIFLCSFLLYQFLEALQNKSYLLWSWHTLKHLKAAILFFKQFFNTKLPKVFNPSAHDLLLRPSSLCSLPLSVLVFVSVPPERWSWIGHYTVEECWTTEDYHIFSLLLMQVGIKVVWLSRVFSKNHVTMITHSILLFMSIFIDF